MKEENGARKRRVRFGIAANPESRVYLAGSFNDWSPRRTKLRKVAEDGQFETTLLLPPGRYEYKFVVDGEWVMDHRCQDWAPNGLGSLNSVLLVAEHNAGSRHAGATADIPAGEAGDPGRPSA